MPFIFTLLFGFAFGGFSDGVSDSRLPVGYIDQDDSRLSQQLHNLLNDSDVIRLEENVWFTPSDLENMVADDEVAAAVIVPVGYGHGILYGKPSKLIFITDSGSTTSTSIESEILTTAIRLESAVRTAIILEQITSGQAPFDYILEKYLAKWQNPPISVSETISSAIEEGEGTNMSLAHTSPGMMLQFALAGLLTSAQILVNERNSRSLQRLLTTATARVHILLGHFLAIFIMIFCQFLLLIFFGQFALGLNYLHSPLGTLIVAFSAALCIAALGLLIGVIAKNEEQAIILSLIPMFVFSGLGGAWVPLEVTGETFQAVGHISPVAWALDGFKNILIRGLGWESTLLPAAALIGFAILFLALSTWRFQVLQES
jgi:ABC-type multidrug transport system permease subunit